MLFLLYNLLLALGSPALVAYLVYRLAFLGKSRDGFRERLGWAPRLPAPPAGGRIWLHAVSAGEVVAAAAIARRLAETAPDAEVVISTTTPAGRAQAERLLPGAVRFYFPFDFLPCAALALLRVRPNVAATVETEIWPNWLSLARTWGIRTALVNGQFADKGFGRARRARWLYRWALGNLDALWMQSRRAAERAAFLGAPADRTRVVGNVKLEQPISTPGDAAAGVTRARLGAGGDAPIWIAGSTHPGEEEQVLDAFRSARRRVPGLRLLLAPRHVERAPQVAALVAARGWTCARRSATGDEPVDVLVLDTMGELAGLYALADVVFVGGSLTPVGGHDILQPIFHGKPTLFGPHMHNQQDLADMALGEGAAVRVADAGALADAVASLCVDRERVARLAAAGERLLRENLGAAQACADLLARLARGDRTLHADRLPAGSGAGI